MEEILFLIALSYCKSRTAFADILPLNSKKGGKCSEQEEQYSISFCFSLNALIESSRKELYTKEEEIWAKRKS